MRAVQYDPRQDSYFDDSRMDELPSLDLNDTILIDYLDNSEYLDRLQVGESHD